MSARDIFEDAREASFELYRHDLKYNAMEQRALSLGGQTDAHVSSGDIADTGATVMLHFKSSWRGEYILAKNAADSIEEISRALKEMSDYLLAYGAFGREPDRR